MVGHGCSNLSVEELEVARARSWAIKLEDGLVVHGHALPWSEKIGSVESTMAQLVHEFFKGAVVSISLPVEVFFSLFLVQNNHRADRSDIDLRLVNNRAFALLDECRLDDARLKRRTEWSIGRLGDHNRRVRMNIGVGCSIYLSSRHILVQDDVRL